MEFGSHSNLAQHRKCQQKFQNHSTLHCIYVYMGPGREKFPYIAPPPPLLLRPAVESETGSLTTAYIGLVIDSNRQCWLTNCIFAKVLLLLPRKSFLKFVILQFRSTKKKKVPKGVRKYFVTSLITRSKFRGFNCPPPPPPHKKRWWVRGIIYPVYYAI